MVKLHEGGIKGNYITEIETDGNISAVMQENLSPWFPTRSDKNWAVHSQKMAGALKFQI